MTVFAEALPHHATVASGEEPSRSHRRTFLATGAVHAHSRHRRHAVWHCSGVAVLAVFPDLAGRENVDGHLTIHP